MPHSSGGGSHGGGSHGGSHGGGSGVRTSRTYFHGASRYIYYDNGIPNEIFCNSDLQKTTASSKAALTFIVGIMAAMYSLMLVAVSFHFPGRLKTDYDTSISISDWAKIMTTDEEAALMDALIDFQDKTGITPYVVTANNEDWQDKYSELEKYAYDLYVERFADEKHWLIIYSEPKVPEASFNDWYWEGMQGDDTDSILDGSELKAFNKEMHKLLEDRSDYTVAEAMTKTFEDNTDKFMRQYITWGTIIAAAVLIVCGITGIILIQKHYKKTEKKYSTAFKVEPNETIEKAQCDYCCGTYVVGRHTNCPYCQAQLPFNAPVFEPGNE